MSIKKIDNYRIRLNEILGVNGNTFIGYNNLSKQEVVIKVLNKSQIAIKYYKNLQAFKQQVKFLHKIRKSASYVVRYLNLLQTHNHFYIIQQFCKGGNLKKMLSQKKLSSAEAFKYIRHILKGFMQLIKKGIHHGNLTPSNILFNNGLMKLADFGLQINKMPQSPQSHIKNTVYIAPEVLGGKSYTEKSDIWSLGFIFYELIYGIVPWKTGGSIKTYMQRIQSEPLQFPSQPQISQQLKHLIRRCLHLNPEKRLQWTDIYLDDIFNGQFLQIQSIDIRLGYILGKIRKSLNQSNIDLQRFFQDQMVTSETILDFDSFQHILSYIDQSLEIDDVKYLFNVFDNSNAKMIEFSSFKNAMEHYDISFQFKPLRKKSRRKFEQHQTKQSPVKEDTLQRALQKLVRQMKQKRIYDINHVLGQQQKDLQRLMSFLQFSTMLRKIDPRLTDDQCRAIHKTIDVNGDGKITYQQFLQSICMFTGSQYKNRSQMFHTHRKSF